MSDNTEPAVLAAGHYLRLVNHGGWEYVERLGAHGVVAVIAVTDDDEIILTEQYRPAVQARIIDLPAGLAGDIEGSETEALSTAARRELEEETGYTASAFRRVATLPSSPGLTSERVELFLAGQVTRVGDGGGDVSEQIVVHVISLSSISEWLEARVRPQRLIDPKIYAALWWIGSRRGSDDVHC